MAADASGPYFDLGGHSRNISTTSAAAQTWFDRGLNWAFGFNHEEALRCFEQAAIADPTCAMAFWGQAYVQGPFYNKPWKFYGGDELISAQVACRNAIDRAIELSTEAIPAELALIDALDVRHANSDMSTQAEFDRSDAHYASSMRTAATSFPDDDDIVALAAEALITRTPWQLWDTSNGIPADGADTTEAVHLLESSFEAAHRRSASPLHPGQCHMYLHVMEMSPRPGDALPLADALRGYAPDSGHLNHMPGHIDVLCGRYADAVEVSKQAVAADARYLASVEDPGFYTSACAHNWHLMIYAAMFLGSTSAADVAVDGMRGLLPRDRLDVEQPHLRATLEAYASMTIHVDVRFGRWEEIAARNVIDDIALMPVTTAMDHYAHGVANAALGRLDAADLHRSAFAAAMAEIPLSRRFFNNAALDVLAVADAMLSGEVEYHSGNHGAAFEHLREAVRRDDALNYSEPWPWMHPPRHALGALLLEQGQVDDAHLEEATAVYRADLGLDPTLPRPSWHPDNVWSLHGLVECYDLTHDSEAETFRPRLTAALEYVDFDLTSSCACRMGNCDG